MTEKATLIYVNNRGDVMEASQGADGSLNIESLTKRKGEMTEFKDDKETEQYECLSFNDYINKRYSEEEDAFFQKVGAVLCVIVIIIAALIASGH